MFSIKLNADKPRIEKIFNAIAIKTTHVFEKGDSIKVKMKFYAEDTKIWGRSHIVNKNGEFYTYTDEPENYTKECYSIEKNTECIIAPKGSLAHHSEIFFIVNDKNEYPFGAIFGHRHLSELFELIK